MKFLGIIPARYGSTRLEGKPLIDIIGKPMIQHVYERAVKVMEDLYVATDDHRIYEAVSDFGGRVIMTSEDHTTGTSRCLEAYAKITMSGDQHFDVIINIQGDEPLLEPEQIETLKSCFTDEYIMMATLATSVTKPSELTNESEAFVVFDKDHNALYFSRSVIPYIKGIKKKNWLNNNTFYKHVGIYAYTPEALEIFSSLKPSKLELTEQLEQNRWLENGHAIRIGFTDHSSLCIDTEEDLQRIREILNPEKNTF